MPSTAPGSPARVSSLAKWIVTDGGAIRYSSGSMVGFPAGTSTPSRARAAITSASPSASIATSAFSSGARAGSAPKRSRPDGPWPLEYRGDAGRVKPEGGVPRHGKLEADARILEQRWNEPGVRGRGSWAPGGGDSRRERRSRGVRSTSEAERRRRGRDRSRRAVVSDRWMCLLRSAPRDPALRDHPAVAGALARSSPRQARGHAVRRTAGGGGGLHPEQRQSGLHQGVNRRV